MLAHFCMNFHNFEVLGPTWDSQPTKCFQNLPRSKFIRIRDNFGSEFLKNWDHAGDYQINFHYFGHLSQQASALEDPWSPRRDLGVASPQRGVWGATSSHQDSKLVINVWIWNQCYSANSACTEGLSRCCLVPRISHIWCRGGCYRMVRQQITLERLLRASPETKCEKKCAVCKMSRSQHFKNVYFPGAKALECAS